MATQYPALDDSHRQFISAQHLFFVATAAPDGRVNLSPKGRDALRVISDNRVLWLNLTGSGNETAAHLKQHPRMTLMFCAFEGQPLILRLYGTARAVHPDHPDWDALYAHFPAQKGARQVYDMSVDLVQNSCGFAVPEFAFTGDRDILANWAEKKGESGIQDYWRERNTVSIDGFETGIVSDKYSLRASA